ncbi:acyl-[acyl-carrier-protein]--UDP-N-acetylglucosamine O-acyltransferase [Chitiniphilus shinanonensis]|uniref:Acyl-[acyl-carrier-protein]--UDP-N-acetylglucosamine O-acyltransferase n=1 Tax=Chitiniphilus shinanonensis TaxID=553088 RepID=A0ABQ6BQ25_9NEIS|nr:acyl-ACP--UDP-N-acetylglucosamine O-acyltransferase [Chitiniphilus shinanonensis]GLS04120.1 acyl-[acyl-carrier-protein]--UDP-N-acetylglucosamine O-acyltransferase [Chitiniphilus shinanonensis]
MTRIHPTAIVDPKAELAADVVVGPYALIGPNVRIGAGCEVGPHVVIDGVTEIGARNRFHPFGNIGCAPQDKKYHGEPTRLEIGEGNTFFQSVTVSVGTVQDQGVTRIGDDNWFMAYMHIGHDCQVGSHTTFANSVTLGGHVHVGDWAVLGGLAAIHQFCVIGAHAMAGGGSIIVQDLPAFVICEGNRASARGVNAEGLKRRGFDATQIAAVKRAYKTLYREGLSYDDARAQIEARAAEESALQPFVDFFALSQRGIIR